MFYKKTAKIGVYKRYSFRITRPECIRSFDHQDLDVANFLHIGCGEYEPQKKSFPVQSNIINKSNADTSKVK